MKTKRRKKEGATSHLQPTKTSRHLEKERPACTRCAECCDQLHHGICFSHFTCIPLQATAAVDTCPVQSQTPAASPSPCHSPGTADPCSVVAKKPTRFLQLVHFQQTELLPPSPTTNLQVSFRSTQSRFNVVGTIHIPLHAGVSFTYSILSFFRLPSRPASSTSPAPVKAPANPRPTNSFTAPVDPPRDDWNPRSYALGLRAPLRVVPRATKSSSRSRLRVGSC